MTASRSARARVLAALGAALLIAATVPDAQSGSSLDRLLTDRMGFSAADLRDLDAGSAVIHSLDTRLREEIAHVGAVYVDAAPEQFVERFRDIEQFERGPGIPQIGRFESPPQASDLELLTLPVGDFAALSQCRPGDCDLKLSAAAMSRFRSEVEWSSAGAARQADDLARSMILDLVDAYRAGGNAALGFYDDDDTPLSVAEQVQGLLASDDPLPILAPALLAYLDTYPRDRPAGAEDFFYWTVVDFGLKPTIRVNHVTIYPLRTSPTSGVAYAIAIKQLYASHYFHTTLELRFVIEHDRGDRPGSALISITRSRNDGMTGFKGFFIRSIIRRRSRDGVRRYLEHVRRQIERPVPASF